MARSRHTVEPADLHRAGAEALLAANVAEARGLLELSFEETGAYRLLLPAMSEDPTELQGFFDETVAPLVAYDEQYETELVRTLETFLDADGNVARTAEKLFTHRHTIRYRLERVKELTTLDVSSTDGRERLSLGLKAMRVLGIVPPGGPAHEKGAKQAACRTSTRTAETSSGLRSSLLELVLPKPFTDCIVGDAIPAASGGEADCVNLSQQLCVRRPVHFSARRARHSRSVPAHAALSGAIALAAVAGSESPPVTHAILLNADQPTFPGAVSFQGRRAVRADDAQVAQAVVVGDAVDVIDYQAHHTSSPHFALAA